MTAPDLTDDLLRLARIAFPDTDWDALPLKVAGKITRLTFAVAGALTTAHLGPGRERVVAKQRAALHAALRVLAGELNDPTPSMRKGVDDLLATCREAKLYDVMQVVRMLNEDADGHIDNRFNLPPIWRALSAVLGAAWGTVHPFKMDKEPDDA